jgi:hypothetical protein
MSPLRKFLRLSPADRWLLVKSAFWLGLVVLGLRAVPFRTLRRGLAKVAHRPTPLNQIGRPEAGRLAWAVALASRYVPAASCLPQALVTHLLLTRQGYPAHLYIGVAKDELGQLQAHAWIESQGRILIGAVEDLSRFNPLPPVEGESA